MNKPKQWYLQTMGIQVWEPRKNPLSDDATRLATKLDVSALDWRELREHVSECALCALHKTRTQTVFGVGNPAADLVIIGEAPGAQEDKQGEPFVGRAGKLLDEMLCAIGFKRNEIYIANILKCRPPSNRDPKPEEQVLCTPYLLRQIELLQPKLILALGRIAAHYLLNSELALGRLRNATHYFGSRNIPLMVSYHPAYLLRNPSDKKKAYEDLLKVRSFLKQV